MKYTKNYQREVILKDLSIKHIDVEMLYSLDRHKENLLDTSFQVKYNIKKQNLLKENITKPYLIEDAYIYANVVEGHKTIYKQTSE